MPSPLLGIPFASPCSWQVHYGEAVAHPAGFGTLTLPRVVPFSQDSCVPVFESESTPVGLWRKLGCDTTCAAAAATKPRVSSRSPLSSCLTLASHFAASPARGLPF